MIQGNLVKNSTLEEMKLSVRDRILAGNEDGILMIEGYCDFLSEDQVKDAFATAHEGIKPICQTLSDRQKFVGKEPR